MNSFIFFLGLFTPVQRILLRRAPAVVHIEFNIQTIFLAASVGRCSQRILEGP